MEAKKCYQCGTRHWSNEPCVLLDIKEATEVKLVVKPTKKVKKAVFSRAGDPKSFTPDAGSGVISDKPKFDRTTYQREFMRRKRAKQRAMKP